MNHDSPILLVDDDDNDVLLAQIAFQEAGLSNPLPVVRNGAEAIHYLSGDGIYADRARFPIPGLVLLDLNMPLLSGFQVLEWLQHHPASNVVAIVLTASSNPNDVERAMSLGAADYRVKPTNSAHLVPIFRELHARWLAPGQVPEARAVPPPLPTVPLPQCQP